MEKTERKVAVMNPYDAIGQAHNKGMDFVIGKLNSQEEIKYERIVELVSQYLASLRSKGTHESDCLEMNEEFILGYVSVGNTLNLLSTYSTEELLEKGKYNKEQICLMESILNVSEERALDREGTIKILQNIEEQILASDLTPEEAKVPLILASIAKYSVSYWMEQIKNDSSEWKSFIDGDLAKLKWPWKADALGALTGAGGGIIGVIGGALGGSLAAALGLS